MQTLITCTDRSDLTDARPDAVGEAREGVTKYMLSVEGCDLMGASAETLDHWESMGVRMAALTWNHPNALATPHCVNSTDGLTPFGRESVKRMIAKKIAVDVSHLNEQGFWSHSYTHSVYHKAPGR